MGEVLRAPVRRRAVQQDRGALGGVGVLVGVDRDRGDAVDRERPRRHVATDPCGVRQHPAADAGVDVAADPARGSGGGDRRHRVDDAVRVRRRGDDDQHGALGRLVDRRDHRVGVGAEVGADRDDDGLDPEVVGGLEEGRVHGRRHDHPRALDVGAAVARALDGQQAGLGATGGHRADRLGRRVEQVGGEADQVVLHLQQARERRRVEPVRAGVRRHRLAADLVDVGQPGVVDVGERPASVDGEVGGLHGAEAGECVGHGATFSSTSAESSEYLLSHHRLSRTRTAGSTEKPRVIAVSAESGWATSPSVDDW